MKTFWFVYMKEDELNQHEKGFIIPPYPPPHYLGMIHCETEEEASEIIGRNCPNGYKIGNGILDDDANFIMDFRCY